MRIADTLFEAKRLKFPIFNLEKTYVFKSDDIYGIEVYQFVTALADIIVFEILSKTYK